MYGDIIEIAENTLFIEGKRPSSVLKEPDIANSVVYKSNDTLYLFDTGATPYFRERVQKAIEQLKPFNKFILFNSHSHSDHTGNNSLIQNVDAKIKEHYISQVGISRLDAQKDFRKMFKSIREYHDYLDSPTKFPFNLIKLLKVTRILGDNFPLKIFMNENIILKKFRPIEVSKETAVPFERNVPINFSMADTKWTGWNFNNDVYAMEARGHFPDEIIFFLPKIKTLILADETFEFFNCWPDSNTKNTCEVINKAVKMLKSGEADILISGHTHTILNGNNAVDFLNILLKDHLEFKEKVITIVKDSSSGITVNEIYNKLKTMENVPSVEKYLNLEFPKMPPFLKTVITSLLLEYGCKTVGKRGKKQFSI